MYNPTKRQKEIIDVSIGLIAESGIQNLTIRNISEKIRISEPAIYRHYNSKLDIILSILEFFGNNSKFMLDKLDSEDISPLKKLEKLYLKRCKEFSEKPEITRVLFSEEIFQNEKILSEKVKEIMTIHRNFKKFLLKIKLWLFPVFQKTLCIFSNRAF